jgi:hypothetical protein
LSAILIHGESQSIFVDETVFMKRELRKIFRPQRENVTEGWRKLENEPRVQYKSKIHVDKDGAYVKVAMCVHLMLREECMERSLQPFYWPTFLF